MEFGRRKAAAIAAMGSAVKDKSPKGTIDAPIVPLLNALNSHPSYFTTSSCSGRISILAQPITPTTNSKKSKGGSWLFVTHGSADPNSVIDLLFHSDSPRLSTQISALVFRFEPLIIAVECVDVGSAQSLVSIAISCGFRESGITSVRKRVIVAIRSSIRLEVPLGDTDRIMVSEEFVRYVVGIANEKMEANRQRSDGILRAFMGTIESGDRRSSHSALDDHRGLLWNESQGSNDITNQQRCSQREEDVDDGCPGSSRYPGCYLSIVELAVVGQLLENLFLWGHSACCLDTVNGIWVLVFGGFGGMGRHARRNESWLLDPLHGTLKAIYTSGVPFPRMGHTSSLAGHSLFVIGGRAGPTRILNDVLVLNTSNNEWNLLNCSGCFFPPRHRHAAAVINSKIFVFGGLNNDLISSSLHVLDASTLQWNEVGIRGEWPSARHSHSLVAYGSKLFMFGGYDGEKPLGDLYSFDTQRCLWKRERMSGKAPHARFSHLMFIYKHYIGIIGGCPVGQNCQVLTLLDLQLRSWRNLVLNTVGKSLFVRSTANIVGDDLVVIGGGASCYAFGTVFSKPTKVSLLPLNNFDQPLAHSEYGLENVNLNIESESAGMNVEHEMAVSNWVICIWRSHGKLVKDVLKQFGWLDRGRKVYSTGDRQRICFPVTNFFCSLFSEKQHNSRDAVEGLNVDFPGPHAGDGFSVNALSSLSALSLLKACGSLKIPDDTIEARRAPKCPVKLMRDAAESLLKCRGLLTEQLLEQLPKRWDKLGDIVVLPVTCFKDPVWDSLGEELWEVVAKSLNARRLARQGRVAPNGTRDSNLEILVGGSGWVSHCENGICYSFDATKCMFSWGNLSEKLRMSRLHCRDEIIVDLFAGIGYFTLPFLVRAKAKLVYACEWNPHAMEALKYNVEANHVADRCVLLEGDNQLTAPKGVADRVCLGFLPTSEGSWPTAIRALRAEGGVLHVHGTVKDLEEASWAQHVSKAMAEIAKSEGRCWDVWVEQVERVKWYAPHIRHLVVDVACRPIQHPS